MSAIHKLVLKPVAKSLDWVEFTQGALSANLKASRELLSQVGHGISFIEFPKKVSKLYRSITLGKHSIEIFKNAMAVTCIGVTALEVLNHSNFLSLTTRQIFILNGVGFIACIAILLKSLVDIKKNFTILNQSERWGAEFNTAFLNIGIKICAIVGAILGMIVFLSSAEAPSKFTLLGVTSVGLFFSISKYYYNKTYFYSS